MAALVCPLCSASTKGNGDPFDSAQSVEAHISASTDDVHRGEQGKDYRDVIGSNGTQDAVANADDGGDPQDGARPPPTDDGAQADVDADMTTEEAAEIVNEDPDWVAMDVETYGEQLEEAEGYGREQMREMVEAMEEELQAAERRAGEPDTLDCPHCGEDTGETEEKLRDEGPLWQCDGCDGEFEVV